MKHLKELRKKAGFKNAESACKHLGYSISAIRKVESGNRKPSINFALKMAKIYKCSMDDIFLPYDFAESEVCKNIEENILLGVAN